MPPQPPGSSNIYGEAPIPGAAATEVPLRTHSSKFPVSVVKYSTLPFCCVGLYKEVIINIKYENRGIDYLFHVKFYFAMLILSIFRRRKHLIFQFSAEHGRIRKIFI